MRRLAAALSTLVVVVLAPQALAAEPQASLPDIEDEVMCTICGTTLQLSNAPQAERERALINELIAAGKDKEEIKAALVDEYGSEVLAVPSSDGFDLAAWIVPIAGIAVALIAVGLAARRWRRVRDDEQTDLGDPVIGIDPDDEERLRADLSRYEL